VFDVTGLRRVREGDADSVVRSFIDTEFIVAATQVLQEPGPGRGGLQRPVLTQPAHRPQPAPRQRTSASQVRDASDGPRR
jgi:hypothetical protein